MSASQSFSVAESPASGALWAGSSQASSARVSQRRQRPIPATGGTLTAMYFRNVFGHTRQYAAASARFFKRGFMTSEMFQFHETGNFFFRTLHQTF
jgi:hypothetical protein